MSGWALLDPLKPAQLKLNENANEPFTHNANTHLIHYRPRWTRKPDLMKKPILPPVCRYERSKQHACPRTAVGAWLLTMLEPGSVIERTQPHAKSVALTLPGHDRRQGLCVWRHHVTTTFTVLYQPHIKKSSFHSHPLNVHVAAIQGEREEGQLTEQPHEGDRTRYVPHPFSSFVLAWFKVRLLVGYDTTSTFERCATDRKYTWLRASWFRASRLSRPLHKPFRSDKCIVWSARKM